MDSFGDGAHTIIAGASGLVGTELLEQLLSFQSIASVTALVRQPLEITNNKLIQIQDAQLRVTEWDESHADPDLGFICLGTTKKQAGSKQALAHVDIELVTQVAHTMKMLGVKRIAVISSYGASLRSLSHYLRCKGRMERNLSGMDFERIVFVRPGPLAGQRATPRIDEVILGRIAPFIRPFLIGPLANLKHIQADRVAQSMLYTLIKPLSPLEERVVTLTSSEMEQMLHDYHLTE